ncbi:hypothetical protein VPH35_019899 [Triticum aestivum]
MASSAPPFLLLLLFVLVAAAAASEERPHVTPTFIHCHPAQATANASSAKNATAFQANVMPLLAKLPSAAAPMGFASLGSAGVVGRDRAFVRGLCFGHATPSQCGECLAAAAKKLADRRAGVWTDGCFASYAARTTPRPTPTASARASSPAPPRSPPAPPTSCRASPTWRGARGRSWPPAPGCRWPWTGTPRRATIGRTARCACWRSARGTARRRSACGASSTRRGWRRPAPGPGAPGTRRGRGTPAAGASTRGATAWRAPSSASTATCASTSPSPPPLPLRRRGCPCYKGLASRARCTLSSSSSWLWVDWSTKFVFSTTPYRNVIPLRVFAST